MPEPAERLALLREGVDCQLGLCVDLPTFHGLAGGIDDYQARAETARAQLIKAAEPRVEAAVTRLVDEATAMTLDQLGERKRSVRAMARHIRTVVEVPEEP